MRLRPSYVCCAAALVGAAASVHAQVIDEVEVHRVGDDAVIQLRYVTAVRFQRAIATRSNDLIQVTYLLLTTTNSQLRTTQGLRLGEEQGLPDVRIADEADDRVRGRRLVLSFAEPTVATVRPGAGDRTIEIVLPGRGAAVEAAAARTAPAPPPVPPPSAAIASAALPEAERRFIITLHSSPTPDLQLTRPVPSTLQDYAVFTERRVVDGTPRYEINLGYFATRAQAEGALRALSAFPKAEIVSLAPPAAAAAIAAPTAPPPTGEVAAAAAAAASGPAPPSTAASAPPVAVAPAPTEVVPAAPATAPASAPGTAVPAAQQQVLAAVELEARAAALLNAARSAYERQDYAAAIQSLDALLNLPPNASTQDGQEIAGMARLRSGDTTRARIEFETYLRLYAEGAGSDRVRQQLAALPQPAAPTAGQATAKAEKEVIVTGSTSMYYYGGNGKVRSLDFQDSPVGGVPQVVGDPLLATDKARQLFNDVDLSWRQRDTDNDMRFVFRDSYITDLERPEKSRNRLSALYLDYRSRPHGFGVRLGRQSPSGGGVMGRFDGAQANYQLLPKIKLGAVAGQPADRYFDSRRRFYGASVDAEGIVNNLGAGLYVIQQTIDGEVDRRAVGVEARYFQDGVSAFSQIDYDVVFNALNIASLQGTAILEDNTVFTALYDRRSLQMLALANSLTFADPSGTLFMRIGDKLATTTLDALRDQVKRTTPFITQAQLGVTKPLTPKWQVGGNVQLTNIGAIPPVPEVPGFEAGRPATGNIYSVSGQVIGLNLYSPRDTHVFSVTGISSAALDGLLLSYNNSSVVWQSWQFEPSLQYYRDRTAQGGSSERWTPGLRLTYRGFERWAIETALTYEIGHATRVSPNPTDPALTVTTRENSTRVIYSLGARYEF